MLARKHSQMADDAAGTPPAIDPPIPGLPEGTSHPSPKPDPTAASRAFMAEVDRRAASIVKARLGVSLEEAEQIVRSDRTNRDQDSGAAQTANAAVAKHQADLAKVKAELAQERTDRAEEKRKAAKAQARAEDRIRDIQVQNAAQVVGFRDPDYALTMYARALSQALSKTPPEQLEPSTYFQAVKADPQYSWLFKGQAAVVEAPKPVVAPTTAPPESGAPGQETPPPPPPGAAALPPVEDIDKMDDVAFAQRTRSKFGWSPGAM